MNTAIQLLAAMRQNPNDWAMAKLLTVAKQYGMEVRSTGGSHHVFSHPSVKYPLSFPAHRPIKSLYIKRFAAPIDQIQEQAMIVKTIAKVKPAFPFEAYSHVLSPMDAAEGGGFMFTMPDIPGVLADGPTELEAIADGREAFITTVSSLVDMGQEVPVPAFNVNDFTPASASGKILARLPRSMHLQLAARAKTEGVSLNALLLVLIAEGLGRRSA